MVKGVIFDVDGTLVDSVDLHADAWTQTLNHFGYPVEKAAVRSQIGKGSDQLMPFFIPADQLRGREEAIERYRHDLFHRACMPLVESFPATRALFQRIRADGRRIALASSAKADELRYYKRVADVDDLVDEETTADDAERSKPYPDIFLAALERLDLAPGEVVVVGDSPWDAKAAGTAGIAMIGLLCGGFPEADLRAAGCREIHRSPDDLLRHYDGSLLAGR